MVNLVRPCLSNPCQKVLLAAAAVEEAQRSGWMMQVAVKLLVRPHQPFLLLLRLIQLRELWTAEKGRRLLASEAYGSLKSHETERTAHEPQENKDQVGR